MDVHSVKTFTTADDLRAKVLVFGISSRLFIVLLSWVSDGLVPDHDAGVYLFPPPPVNSTVADHIVQSVFGGLARWDAQYFLHIALYGYTYENNLAFFPLFPFLTRVLAQSISVVFKDLINSLSTVLISAVILNFYFFVNASLKLFELSRKILQDDILAYKAALFFCINPASIFFTAPYSESCFAFFTFSGMLFCVENNKELLSSFALGLSSCTRSNGILNFGYLAHKSLKSVFVNVPMLKLQFTFSVLNFILIQLCKLCIYGILFFAPFLLFQGYAFKTFCTGEIEMADFLKEYGELNGFVMPGSKRSPWCRYTIPFSYSYVQNHYWDVGFLRYYHLKQIPNFILASPVVFLILRTSYDFMLENKSALFSLGFSKLDKVTYKKRDLKPEFFVFVVHVLVLTVFCTFFVHIQVTTRMLASSSPVVYWFVALGYKCGAEGSGVGRGVGGVMVSSRLKTLGHHRFSLVESQRNMTSVWRTVIVTETPADTWSYIVRTYFYFYLIVGTILFSNFLPWT